MNQLIDEFLAFLDLEKGLAPRTIKEYRYNLELLRNFLVERLQITCWIQVTYPHLRAFLHYLADERKNSPRARAMKIATMKGFFHYLYLEEYISKPIGDRLIKPKVDQPLPDTLTPEECERFIQIIRRESRHSIRDSTIILTFLYAGIRLTELCQLDLHDIDLDEGTMRIKGKGNIERNIPMSTQLQQIIQNYLFYREDLLGLESPMIEPLFLTRRYQRWNQINRRTIQDIFNHYASEARIHKKHFSAVKLRHTFATLLYASGVNLLELQQLLGHVKLENTQIYTHTTVEQLKSAIQKHPLSLSPKENSAIAEP